MTRRRSLQEDQSAAVYVEFLIVFMPVFILFLGMTQVALMFSAKLVVQHAASAAARSAVVVLPDDPKLNNDTPQDEINWKVSGDDTFGKAVNGIEKFINKINGWNIKLKAFGVDTGVDLSSVKKKLRAYDRIRNLGVRGDRRSKMIRMAALVPLLSLAPMEEMVRKPEEAQVVDSFASMDENSGRALLQAGFAWLYSMTAMAITFPPSPGGRAPIITTSSPQSFAGYQGSAPNEIGKPLTVRVTYMYTCTVPLISKMVCLSPIKLRTQRPGGLRGMEELNMAGVPIARLALAAGGGRFRMMRSEATMLYQGAGYKYKGQPDATGESAAPTPAPTPPPEPRDGSDRNED